MAELAVAELAVAELAVAELAIIEDFWRVAQPPVPSCSDAPAEGVPHERPQPPLPQVATLPPQPRSDSHHIHKLRSTPLRVDCHQPVKPHELPITYDAEAHRSEAETPALPPENAPDTSHMVIQVLSPGTYVSSRQHIEACH